MLQDYLKKVKNYERDIMLVLTVVLTAIICFNLGRLSIINDKKTNIQINNTNLTSLSNLNENAQYIGSKTGSVYHLTNCSGAKAIKEENKIVFNSREDAEIAGYRPAANCPGLK